MATAKILIADDDRILRRGVLFHLSAAGYDVREAATADEAVRLVAKNSFDLVISDLKIPDIHHGLDIVRFVKEHSPDTIVMVLTGYGSIALAIQAIRAGADDFATKDATVEEIKLKVQRLIQQQWQNIERRKVLKENRRLIRQLQERHAFDKFVGEAPAFKTAMALLKRAAEYDNRPVLLTGEKGTGKALAARTIHYNGRRSGGPLSSIDVTGMPVDLIRTELFGSRGEVATEGDGLGRLQRCAGGTLLLEELGELPIELQSELLQLLTPGKTDIHDVRFIFTTSQDLKSKAAAGEFLRDLLPGLAQRIDLPPLRLRQADIQQLAETFLLEACVEKGKAIEMGKAVFDRLQSYNWPGNVGELKSVVKQLVALSARKKITVEHLPQRLREEGNGSPGQHSGNLADARRDLVRQFEKRFISDALAEHLWNVSRTASAIGVSREGLHRMIRKYGLERD